MMSWLDRAVARVVRDVVRTEARAIIAARVHDIVLDALNRPGVVLRPWVFHRVVANEMMLVDRSLTVDQAKREAGLVVEEVRRETKVWGRPDYGWDAAAAREAAHVFAIDYWEPS